MNDDEEEFTIKGWFSRLDIPQETLIKECAEYFFIWADALSDGGYIAHVSFASGSACQDMYEYALVRSGFIQHKFIWPATPAETKVTLLGMWIMIMSKNHREKAIEILKREILKT